MSGLTVLVLIMAAVMILMVRVAVPLLLRRGTSKGQVGRKQSSFAGGAIVVIYLLLRLAIVGGSIGLMIVGLFLIAAVVIGGVAFLMSRRSSSVSSGVTPYTGAYGSPLATAEGVAPQQAASAFVPSAPMPPALSVADPVSAPLRAPGLPAAVAPQMPPLSAEAGFAPPMLQAPVFEPPAAQVAPPTFSPPVVDIAPPTFSAPPVDITPAPSVIPTPPAAASASSGVAPTSIPGHISVHCPRCGAENATTSRRCILCNATLS